MHPIARLLVERTLLGILTLWVVLTFIFLAIALLPGDLAEAILGQHATPETLSAFRHSLGLDRPILDRYIENVGGILRGDLGRSLESNREVSEILSDRLYNTFFLAGLTASIAVPFALILGMLAALYRDSLFDRIVNSVTLASVSFPDFFVAYLLIYVFTVQVHLFPSMSTLNAGMSIWEQMYKCALPAFTLSLILTAHMMRMTRAAIVNLLSSPFIEMARIKGVHPARIIVSHALPNALPPIINVVLLNLAYLIVGVVVIEVVFVYPGIGQLLVNAVAKRDLPVVQACSLIFAATYIILNSLADVFAILASPRLLHRK